MTFLLNFFLLAAEDGAGAGGGCDSSSIIMIVVVLVAAVALFILPMFTRRKQGKQINDMRSTLRIGDEILTIGGIVGKVVEIHEITATEKDFVLETGNGSTMTFDMRALHENRTRMRELQSDAAKQAEINRMQKEQKKSGKNDVYNTDEKSKEFVKDNNDSTDNGNN